MKVRVSEARTFHSFPTYSGSGQSLAGGVICKQRIVDDCADCRTSEVSDYQSKLKSITGGAGSYAVELSHYEAVPPQAQQKLIADYKATRPQAKDDD